MTVNALLLTAGCAACALLGLPFALSIGIVVALVLIVCAGLFLRSLQQLWTQETGYDRRNVLMFSIDAGHTGNADADRLAGQGCQDFQQPVGGLTVIGTAGFHQGS